MKLPESHHEIPKITPKNFRKFAIFLPKFSLKLWNFPLCGNPLTFFSAFVLLFRLFQPLKNSHFIIFKLPGNYPNFSKLPGKYPNFFLPKNYPRPSKLPGIWVITRISATLDLTLRNEQSIVNTWDFSFTEFPKAIYRITPGHVTLPVI